LERLLKVKVNLAKDPADYVVNNPHKKIEILVGAKAGDVIWYFKTDKTVNKSSRNSYLQAQENAHGHSQRR
jgi:hypothetical protein